MFTRSVFLLTFVYCTLTSHLTDGNLHKEEMWTNTEAGTWWPTIRAAPRRTSAPRWTSTSTLSMSTLTSTLDRFQWMAQYCTKIVRQNFKSSNTHKKLNLIERPVRPNPSEGKTEKGLWLRIGRHRITSHVASKDLLFRWQNLCFMVYKWLQSSNIESWWQNLCWKNWWS